MFNITNLIIKSTMIKRSVKNTCGSQTFCETTKFLIFFLQQSTVSREWIHIIKKKIVINLFAFTSLYGSMCFVLVDFLVAVGERKEILSFATEYKKIVWLDCLFGHKIEMTQKNL